MSFDVSIVFPACAECGSPGREIYSFNLTHNVNDIVDRCLVAGGAPAGRSWYRLSGLTGAQAEPIVRRALLESRSDERAAEFRAMEPDNGWGTLGSVQHELEKFLGELEQWPRARIEASG